MHIKRVRGNLKAGADVEIGPKTLIVGPNGSGKSTIVNIIELALTSRAGDIAGRTDVAREVDVMQLAKDGAELLKAEAEFDNGAIASYSVEGTTAKAKKAVAQRGGEVGHADVLPIRVLREALLGSPETARKFLIGKVGGDVTPEDVATMLPEQFRGHWDTFCGLQASGTRDVATLLPKAIESAGARAREAAGEAKTAREAQKLVSGGRAAPPSASEIQSVRREIDSLQQALESIAARRDRDGRLVRVAGDIAKAETELDGIERAIADKTKVERTLFAQLKPFGPEVRPALQCMQASVLHGECLVCGGKPPTEAEVREIESAVQQNDAAGAEHRRVRAELEKLEAQKKRLIEHATELVAEEDRLRAIDGLPVDPALEGDVRARLDTAQNKLVELRAAQGAWDAVQKAEAKAIDSERIAGEWAGFKEACEKAMAMTLDKALGAFVQKVQAGLPKGDVFDLRLRDGEREVVKFGLVRGGQLHTALSGAEWARVMAAMAGACVPAGKYAILIPEERAFDASTLAAVMRALESSPHQVVLTSPTAPKTTPKGWTVVRRGEAIG